MTIVQQIHEAMTSGDTDEMNRLLLAHPEWTRNRDGKDMWLFRAARDGNLPVVQLLVEMGIGVNESQSGGGPEGAIGDAASEGQTEVVGWLLDHGAKINFEVDGVRRCMPLTGAVLNGHLDVVRLLVERGADINATWAGMNALAFAQSYGQKEIDEYLRSMGAKLPWELVKRDLPSGHAEIRRHVAQYRGAVKELLPKSDESPIAVYVAEPSKDVPWQTVFTIGVSDEGIKLTDGKGAFIEFVMNLPTNWPLIEASLKDERWNWPIEWLRKIARDTTDLRANGTWPAGGHILFPNGDPPQPLTAGTQMTCWIGLPDSSKFSQATLPDTRLVDFCTLCPIYTEERDLVNEKGSEELVQRFQKQGIDRAIDPKRRSVA